MKRLLSTWNYVSINDGNRGSLLALERADYVYIYTDALKHSQYYKAMDIVRKGGKVLYYLGSGNRMWLVDENMIARMWLGSVRYVRWAHVIEQI